MNREYLMRMDEDELEAYAAIVGVDVGGAPTREAKVDLIERRRGRIKTIEVMGVTLDVAVKRLHSKRVSELSQRRSPTDEDIVELLREILGEEQLARVEEACTDEDGTVDTDAYGLFVSRFLTSEELKNY